MEGKDQVFTILQVSERLKIPKHTLRFWEKELNGLVVPLRTSGGQRRYTIQNIEILEEVKRQRDIGLSLPQIIEKISQNHEVRDPGPVKIDLLAYRVAEVVRTEVYKFFDQEKENG